MIVEIVEDLGFVDLGFCKDLGHPKSCEEFKGFAFNFGQQAVFEFEASAGSVEHNTIIRANVPFNCFGKTLDQGELPAVLRGIVSREKKFKFFLFGAKCVEFNL